MNCWLPDTSSGFMAGKPLPGYSALLKRFSLMQRSAWPSTFSEHAPDDETVLSVGDCSSGHVKKWNTLTMSHSIHFTRRHSFTAQVGAVSIWPHSPFSELQMALPLACDLMLFHVQHMRSIGRWITSNRNKNTMFNVRNACFERDWSFLKDALTLRGGTYRISFCFQLLWQV